MLSLLLGNYSNWGYSIIVNEEKGSLTTCKKNYADSIYVRLLVYIKIILWYCLQSDVEGGASAIKKNLVTQKQFIYLAVDIKVLYIIFRQQH